MTTRARTAPEAPVGAGMRPLLVVSPGAGDPDGLFGDLAARAGFRVRFAATPAAADQALAAWPIALLIAGPAVATEAVGALLDAAARRRPGIPVLVIRYRQAEEPPAWARRGVGVLRCPLLPEALARSVEVVLGLAAVGPAAERVRR